MYLYFLVILASSIYSTNSAEGYDDMHIRLRLFEAYHNEKRAGVGASDMKQLRWDPNLEVLALSWASQCTFAVIPDLLRRNVQNVSIYSQNVHISTNQTNADYQTVIDDWMTEKKYYSYTRGICVGRICDDYLNVVSAQYDTIGCAIIKCNSIKRMSNKPGYVTVCNYGPGKTDFEIKQKRPFTKGTPCSQCPQYSQTCYHGLCTKSRSIQRTTRLPALTTAKPNTGFSCGRLKTTKPCTRMCTCEVYREVGFCPMYCENLAPGELLPCHCIDGLAMNSRGSCISYKSCI